MTASFSIRRLTSKDIADARGLLAVFAESFEDPQNYLHNQPSDSYLAARLADPNFIAVGCFDGTLAVGALAGYVLPKIEQERTEIYIYDLGVLESHRRLSIATGLIDSLQIIARIAGAWVIYVQADYGDGPAVALYTKLGTREDVMHFDIAVDRTRSV